ncbi:hypothetical protein N7478_010616 [Penicillium angulare]|uniref:uncharacterized protein n=1 Tax=Penicillium angulare TaxID=116970 RepID=UPI002542122D|nr:uncharacterized protein N7478_010616 [Penicillium angulare]KAJ5267808.1 hypothetical protein N7478_010616 [Penicillium angulare]
MEFLFARLLLCLPRLLFGFPRLLFCVAFLLSLPLIFFSLLLTSKLLFQLGKQFLFPRPLLCFPSLLFCQLLLQCLDHHPQLRLKSTALRGCGSTISWAFLRSNDGQLWLHFANIDLRSTLIWIRHSVKYANHPTNWLSLQPWIIVSIYDVSQALHAPDELIFRGRHDQGMQVYQETRFRPVPQRVMESVNILVIEQGALGSGDRLTEKTLTERDVVGHRAGWGRLHEATLGLQYGHIVHSSETDRARPRSVEIERDRDRLDAGSLIASTVPAADGAGIQWYIWSSSGVGGDLARREKAAVMISYGRASSAKVLDSCSSYLAGELWTAAPHHHSESRVDRAMFHVS